MIKVLRSVTLSAFLLFSANAFAVVPPSKVCEGSTLSLGSGSGTWSSSDNSTATINEITGLVTGIAAGNVNMTFTPTVGSPVVTAITVDAKPYILNSSPNLCIGAPSFIITSSPGGTWSSTHPAVASVDAGTGDVTGITPGRVGIMYTEPVNSCSNITYVNVNPVPVAKLTSGSTNCIGSVATLQSTPYNYVNWLNNGYSESVTSSFTGIDGKGISIGTGDAITPHGTFITPSGDLYVADLLGNRVLMYPAGSTSSTAGTVVAAMGLNLPANIYVDGMGNIFVANYGANNILKFPAGSTSSTVGAVVAANGIDGGSYVAVTDAGNIYVADNNNGRVLMFPSGSTGLTAGTVVLSGFSNIQSIFVDPFDTIYVADMANNSILKFAPGNSTGTVVAGGNGAGTAANQLNNPTGVIVDNNGNIYVADKTNQRIQKFPAGSTGATNGVTVAGTGTAGSGATELSTPQNMSLDKYGNLYVADYGNNRVQKYNGGATADSHTILASGEYTAMVTNAEGCSSFSDTILLDHVGDITGIFSVCQGMGTLLSDTSIGGTWSSSDPATAFIHTTAGAVIGLQAGFVAITYTTPAGCTSVAPFEVSAVPDPITGVAEVCPGNTITLSSNAGGTWSSASSNVSVSSFSGDVYAWTAGTATVTYAFSSGCSATATVTINPLPISYAMAGDGAYCMGTVGATLGLATSDAGISYQLYNSATPMGSAVIGTGSSISFGTFMPTGIYYVTATNPATGCMANMSTYTNVYVNPLPPTHIMTGGGNYCTGGTGVTVGLSNSNGGVDYQLYIGGVPDGAPLSGTGTALDFGLQTTPGVYSVKAINPTTGCTRMMADTSAVTITPLVTPTLAITTTINSSFCEGKVDTFVASITNGGPSPYFQWSVNGVDAGVNNQSFSYIPVAGDIIVAIMTSNAMCLATAPTVSDVITATTDKIYIPSVDIIASATAYINKGQTNKLTAIVKNGGPAPTYQWYRNMVIVPGATTSSYTANNFADRDSISCVVRGTGACSYPTFNGILIRVNTTGINELTTAGDIHVLPNPNKGTFTISGTLSSTNDQEAALEITNMLGQTVYSNKVQAQNGAIEQQVQLGNNIARGMYLLNIRTATDNKVLHVVVE